MTERDYVGPSPVDAHKGEDGEEDCEAMSLDRLVLLTDTDGLVRMGLGLMEAFAQAKGRILWH